MPSETAWALGEGSCRQRFCRSLPFHLHLSRYLDCSALLHFKSVGPAAATCLGIKCLHGDKVIEVWILRVICMFGHSLHNTHTTFLVRVFSTHQLNLIKI